MVSRSIVVGWFDSGDPEWDEEGANFFAQVGEYERVRGRHMHPTILEAVDNASLGLTLLFERDEPPVRRRVRDSRKDTWECTCGALFADEAAATLHRVRTGHVVRAMS